MNGTIRIIAILVLLFFNFGINAQTSDKAATVEEKSDYSRIERNTFKTVLLINSPTVRTPRKNQLLFILSHRFGYLSSGFSDLFGLDNATARFAFEYGVSKKLALGIGRSTYNRNYDSYIKYALLQQSEGARNIPVSLSLVQTINTSSAKWPNNYPYLFAHRISYSSQILIARKFNSSLSLQLMPTFVHKNLVPTANFGNDHLALGMGGRLRLNSWLALTTEYYHLFTVSSESNLSNPFSLGLDMETSGHIFQLFFTNTNAVYEAAYITENNDQWKNGNIRFGFNLIRNF